MDTAWGTHQEASGFFARSRSRGPNSASRSQPLLIGHWCLVLCHEGYTVVSVFPHGQAGGQGGKTSRLPCRVGSGETGSGAFDVGGGERASPVERRDSDWPFVRSVLLLT